MICVGMSEINTYIPARHIPDTNIVSHFGWADKFVENLKESGNYNISEECLQVCKLSTDCFFHDRYWLTNSELNLCKYNKFEQKFEIIRSQVLTNFSIYPRLDKW